MDDLLGRISLLRHLPGRLCPSLRNINLDQKSPVTSETTMNRAFAVAVVGASLLSGCFNMPTAPSQITGAYVSSIRYETFDCDRLSAELESLARRENQLVSAQEQRVKTSQMQAFWLGYGQGDGVEASELASVRGEREAVRKAIEVKACKVDAALLQSKVEPEKKK